MTYKELLERYTRKHGELHKDKNLHKSLWLAQSMGLERGFTDLGTYVDKPGDHGIGPPCFAFDLGRKNRFFNKGWNYLTARRLAKLYVREHEALSVNYVILGRRIWGPVKPASGDPADAKPYWHPLTTGDTSHAFHLHVSGVHD